MSVAFTAQLLRDMVRDYRDPDTSEETRETIRSAWRDRGIPNQFAAMLRAAELDRAGVDR